MTIAPVLTVISLFLTLALCPSHARAQEQNVTRFSHDQLRFLLIDSDGERIQCRHELLPHVPWWHVTCGRREYTVDTWLQMLRHKTQKLTKVTLMYDVSESVKSSGEKGVQFNSHITTIVIKDWTTLTELSSSIDVRNGMASLEIEVRL